MGLHPAGSRSPGKRGRVVELKRVHLAAREPARIGDTSVLVKGEALHEDTNMPIDTCRMYTRSRREGHELGDHVIISDASMYTVPANAIILDLYGVDEASKGERVSVPFVHWVELAGPKGEIVRCRGTADNGAMVNAIDERVYEKVEKRLSRLERSERWLRMADGRVVPSLGVWRGQISMKGVSCQGSFEIFNGGSAWELLIGKPLLETFGAVHDYSSDVIHIPERSGNTWVSVPNEHDGARVAAVEQGDDDKDQDVQMRGTNSGDSQSPSREVSDKPPIADEIVVDSDKPICVTEQVHEDQPPAWKSVWMLDEAAGNINQSDPGVAQPEVSKIFPPSLLTRKTEPHKPERVATILNEVTFGDDLDEGQRQQARDLIAEFADCFALAMSEVTPVPGAHHRLDIPRDTKFKTKVGQRPLSAPQKEYFNTVLDTMLAADIIEPIDYQDVKCCGATTLAQKAHDGGGLTLEELQHRLNDECVEAGRPSSFNLPPRPVKESNTLGTLPPSTAAKAKWHVCQDFAELNKVTQVLPMPQGDIRAKQQKLGGHRWISVFDFANGFYACEILVEDRPYICFYVEGRGYFAYKRMPFGLTGAPSTFAQMTARALGDLTGTLFELFVDDGGMAGDVFEDMLQNTRKLLQRVRDTGLSLSAPKSRFFMSEAVFAGGRVGKEGIKPDLTKLTAIVEWKRPSDLQNLGAFLGLAGYFRSLIKGYAAIAQPLTDLVRSVDIPRAKGKSAYKRAMKGYSLEGVWEDKHTEAFLRLKVALTQEPILKGPKYDGTPFVVTTDGCKYGFAGMVTQRHTSVLPNGEERSTMHPIAFFSKRTSPSEEKYKPFLLEFAALKFTLDKCADMVWGYAIELETDCQALRDHLLNEKLSSTHARWRDGVLAFNIVDVRHRPGRLNPVADGLSRMYVNLPVEHDDGHEWTVSEDWEARTRLEHDVFQVIPLEEDVDTVRAQLRKRFAKEKVFLEVVDAIYDLDAGKSLRDRRKARHKAQGYMVEHGKLWRVGSTIAARAKPRVECVTQEEAQELAWDVHRTCGHFHRDNIKIQLMNSITSPKLDQSITKAIMDCGKCKAFGPTHLHSLLEPITRRHPFELMVADTLSMPKGKGGYTKLGMYMDVYSQRLWVEKLKSAATGKTSVKGFSTICNLYTKPETLMSDGGPEFDNHELREECENRGTKLHIVAAYSPWVNGLIEGTNSKLLAILKRMAAPDLGEDEVNSAAVPYNWPDHLDAAVHALNERILPSLKFSPNELLLGLVVNTSPTPESTAAATEPTCEEVSVQMAYVSQQRLDGYSQIVEHAAKRKAAFDRKVMARLPREVVFKEGEFVQVYRSDLDYTFKTEKKLLPKWSAPRRVILRNRNSYQLETLEGFPIPGHFSARRLRRFIPRAGTELEKLQEALEEEWRKAGAEGDAVELSEEMETEGSKESGSTREIARREDVTEMDVDCDGDDDEFFDADEGDDGGHEVES